MRPFVSVSDMSRLDQQTMSERHISAYELMNEVAKSASDWFLRQMAPTDRLWVLCGPGNNGGDGYCIARILREAGRSVHVIEVMKPRAPEAKRAAKSLKGPRLSAAAFNPQSRDWILDAIFGNGAADELSPPVIEILRTCRRSGAKRVAMDVPTGLSGRGRVHPSGFAADWTLAVAYPKLNFLSEEAAQVLGIVEFVGGKFCRPSRAQSWALESSDFILPMKAKTSYKGNHGSLGVVGGSAQKPGAAMMAAEAAARMGAGYVSLLFAQSTSKIVLKVFEASFLLEPRWRARDLQKYSALVVGCGERPPKQFIYRGLLTPLVIDASALSQATSKEIKDWASLKSGTILTPHVGEAAALLKLKSKDILKDRIASLEALVQRTGQSVYLKGSQGLLKFGGHFSDQKLIVNLSTNPVFATAGSGDILSGILGGCLARYPDQFKEMVCSALVFQRVLGEAHLRTEGAIASDQLHWFAEAFQTLRERSL